MAEPTSAHGLPDPLDLSSLRAEYARGGLDVGDLTDEPTALFTRWLGEAVAAGLHEPNAMVLATASPQGKPSSRMVLLKGYGADGFVFFTNTGSRKGRELAANPFCALLFGWHPLERQVRIEGLATRLPGDEVAAYFGSRPRGAQIGAWASQQSRPVADRDELTRAYDRLSEEFADGPVPVPPQWGGYRVRPDAMEFWQGRPGRMHDRFRYERSDQSEIGWQAGRLAP